MKTALEKIASVAGAMYRLNGVNIGTVASAAVTGSDRQQRAALETIAGACRGNVNVDGVDIGAVARAALEAA